MGMWAAMACLTHLQCTLVQQQDLWTLQHIFQTMSLDLTTCGLSSQSSQIWVQLGLLPQITFHAVKLMQVCLGRLLAVVWQMCFVYPSLSTTQESPQIQGPSACAAKIEYGRCQVRGHALSRCACRRAARRSRSSCGSGRALRRQRLLPRPWP